MTRPARNPKPVVCPFQIVIDTRESRPYTFESIRADLAQGGGIMEVPTKRLCLKNGDYSLMGFPQVTVERKSLPDLFGSISNRANFINRLERMSADQLYSAVVIEAEISEIMTRPPHFSKLRPKSVMATILAWQMRYPVAWWFLPGREAAEVWTFRILNRFYKEHVINGGVGATVPEPAIGSGVEVDGADGVEVSATQEDGTGIP